MSTTIQTTATGVSPQFKITAEEFKLDFLTTVTDINIDGVKPPNLGPDGGTSVAMDWINLWFPWIDDKLVEPKYDGVARYLGMPSNRPSYIKDFHIITLFRAVDYVMAPKYEALFIATVDQPTPIAPPPLGS